VFRALRRTDGVPAWLVFALAEMLEVDPVTDLPDPAWLRAVCPRTTAVRNAHNPRP
jgi:hypothetical protein